jgi:hypothetical protein
MFVAASHIIDMFVAASHIIDVLIAASHIIDMFVEASVFLSGCYINIAVGIIFAAYVCGGIHR